jgi:SAM-dependent methyltransferase
MPDGQNSGLEEGRIFEAYKRRRDKAQFFVYHDRSHIQRIHERYRRTLGMLAAAGIHPLTQVDILDIGCGDGNMLRQFVQWGAQPENLAGIELRPDPVARSLALSPNIDVRCGSAVELPWQDQSFDLVCQHTVFTSILDKRVKGRIAAEMRRVLRPGGAVLWYDFFYNNPQNPDVRGVKAGEIRELFPGFRTQLQKTTLAPPLARRIPAWLLPVFYPLLAGLPFLRTHYLGLLYKPKD